jgi:glycerol-3-phosphate dehydrogenase (NAD(P)+)
MAHPPVLILGNGGWGTALALVLAQAGREVRVWGHDAAYAASVSAARENARYLPGVRLPPAVTVGADIRELASGVREVLCVELPSRILAGFLPRARIVVLSGPSHAEEVSRGLPTTVVAAAVEPAAAREVQALLSTPRFRIYTSADPVGVEVGGAAKNVIAIAAGIADGLGFGDNARAGLLTRGLREIARLGVALGGREETFAGLSGMGDLIATCTSEHSRNRAVGWRLARGETLAAILASTRKVAEGVDTTRSICALGRRLNVSLPIAEEVHRILFEGKPARGAVEDLMARKSTEERN